MSNSSDDRISFFPEEEDERLMKESEKLLHRVVRLNEWIGKHSEARRGDARWELSESDQMAMLELAREARSLFTSSGVPAACAIYGPSQVGKSLLIGRILEQPEGVEFTPLGRDENQSMHKLSFYDLNPSTGSNEATALVTRFTTNDRMDQTTDPAHPVMVRALTRMQWLSVLARGFEVQIEWQDKLNWTSDELENLFEELRTKKMSDEHGDRFWQDDLVQAYSYIRRTSSSLYTATPAEFSGLLARFPLSEEGYVKLAANLFWEDWDRLTQLFRDVNQFVEAIQPVRRDKGRLGDLMSTTAIMTEWEAVRFLLDVKRVTNPSDREYKWDDFKLVRSSPEDFFTLRRDGSGGISYRLGVVQAGMLEMLIPVIPERLTDYWRRVLKKMDLLDVPGMVAVGGGAVKGGRNTWHKIEESAEDPDEECLDIAKRGKVAFLFESYVQDRLVQTLLLLARGGKIEVGPYMKAHVESWGHSRYESRWPEKVNEEPPALLIGMTGIDEEFEKRSAVPELYTARINNLRKALQPLLTNFGGRKFRHLYPLRYPGTWDSDAKGREHHGPEKWQQAGEAFLECEDVKDYVLSPKEKWDAAMRDGDGGLSLISDVIFQVTDPRGKRKELAKRIHAATRAAFERSRDWYLDAEPLKERKRRGEHAAKVLEWLYRDRGQIYHRVQALNQTLVFDAASVYKLAELNELNPEDNTPHVDSFKDRLRKEIRNRLDEWCNSARDRWNDYMRRDDLSHDELKLRYLPELFGEDDYATLVAYLKDYLCTKEQFDVLCDKIKPIARLKMKDEAALKQSRRRNVRLILNDFVLNPGSGIGKLAPLPDLELPPEQNFGLMQKFVERWRHRLPAALATGAHSDGHEPAGNSDLGDIRDDFDFDNGDESGGNDDEKTDHTD